MQNLVPDAMKLNKFQHVEIPSNNVLYLRTVGRSIPTGPEEVQQADFFSRKTERLVAEEQQFLKDYQSEMNRIDKENSTRHESDATDTHSLGGDDVEN